MSADIEHLRAVGRAATEGPWHVCEEPPVDADSCVVNENHDPVASLMDEWYEPTLDEPTAVHDAAFIATARNEWDGLLDELERLRAKVADARDALDRTHRHGEWQTRQAVFAALADESEVQA